MEAKVEQEREIPVFTVVKNNAILKNIFLINSPPSLSETRREDSSKTHQDFEQTLLVGRHPDCNIRLEHPSISRFHLRIHCKPSSKRLSVTDLSSVHGTWISGQRIEPNVRVDVNEGDALGIGGSSRVYRLQWIPFHKAYDLNNPFVPPLDVPPPEEERGEEMKRDENALVLENELQPVDSALEASKDLVSNQFEASEESEDLDALLCKNEDGKSLVLGCEHSMDSALEALVSNQFETSKEMEDGDALGCKNEDEKSVDSPSEALKYLALNPNSKPLEEIEVSSMAPLPEAMKAVHMPLESRDTQLVNFAWEGSEILLLDKNPPMHALEETRPLHTLQKDIDYSHDIVFKYEEMPLMLKLKDSMNFSADMEENEEKEWNVSESSTGPLEELAADMDEDKQKEWNISESSTGPLEELAVGLSKENDEYKRTPWEDCSSLTLPIESISLEKENQQFEEEKESSKDRLFSPDISPIKIQLESPSGLALSSSHLMENLDGAISELFADETSPVCNDEEEDGAWSFWSPSSQGATLENDFINLDEENQGPECENAMKESNSLEDSISGVTESSLWSFWSGIPGAESVYSSSLSDAEVLSQVETQSANHSSPQIQTNRTFQERICSIGITHEGGMLNRASYETITRALFVGADHPEEKCFTPEKENYTLNARAPERNSGRLEDKHNTGLEQSPLWSANAKAGIASEKGLSAYSNKENQTPKVLQEQKSGMHLSAEHTNLSMLKKRETQRIPLQTLFADSPCKSISGTHVSGASLSAYSNKENQTPKILQERKSAMHPSGTTKLSILTKRETQRTPLQTLFADSPQKIIAETLSAYSNKENQTPKVLQEEKSAWHSSAQHTKLSTLGKREIKMTPLQTLFLDSPQKNIAETHISSGSSLSAYSNKENQTPKFLQEQKPASHPSAKHENLSDLRKREAQRKPFQALFVDSPQKSTSNAHVSGDLARRDFTNYENSMDKNKYCDRRVKRWTMVVDVACLLDKNSRKALQLLEGIKGTQLIIPSIVVKELDFMKQQASIFRKNTDACLASQWIEECVDRTKWWIQIQSSMEDRVLDYALYLKRTQSDGQLVLLSDDTTTKIKAMEEGLICESAEEFHQSLVNPFSKRFLWAHSSPRGQTWSCLDDVILRQNFYPDAMKTTTKAVENNAKGLKLILLHNSMYW